jgi:CrcB protein
VGRAGYLAVFLGAALGGAARHGVNLATAALLGGGLPYGTLAVNVLGGFAMGLAVEIWARRSGLSQLARLFMTTGVLGGFTTFSTFSLDTVTLLQDGRPGAALGYALASVIGAIGGLFVGLACARAVVSPPGG